VQHFYDKGKKLSMSCFWLGVESPEVKKTENPEEKQ